MSLYDKLDEMIMCFTNWGFKRYNEYVGGTKTSLANTMLNFAPIFEVGGVCHMHPSLGIPLAPITLMLSYTSKKKNLEQEVTEQELVDKGVKLNPDSEYFRENKQKGALFTIGAGGGFYAGGAVDPVGGIFAGVGQTIRTASHYIMRADDLPPRKGKIEEFLESSVDKLKNINWGLKPERERIPVTIPVPRERFGEPYRREQQTL